MNTVARSLAFALPLLCIGCGAAPDTPRDGKDVSVVASPDGKYEAVVRAVDIDGSVGVSQPYQVLLRQVGRDGQAFVVLIADKTDGVRLKWRDVRNLEVCYDQAHFYGFRNSFAFVEANGKSVSETEVELAKRRSLQECG